MRLMLAALLVLAGAWSVYWWIGSGGERDRVAAWLEETREVSASNQVMRGFPNRYDTTLEDVSLNAGSLVWTMPRLQLFRLSYQQGHYVVSFATEHSLTFEDTPYKVTMQDGRASVVFRAGTFDHSNAVFDMPAFEAATGATLSASTLLFASRLLDNGHEIGINIAALTSGDAASDLRLDGVLTFAGGVPEGTLTVTAIDPAALEAISTSIGLPELTNGAELTFSDGQVKLANRSLGAAPRFPF